MPADFDPSDEVELVVSFGTIQLLKEANKILKLFEEDEVDVEEDGERERGPLAEAELRQGKLDRRRAGGAVVRPEVKPDPRVVAEVQDSHDREGPRSGGVFEIGWDMKNEAGKEVASGVYLAVVRMYEGDSPVELLVTDQTKVAVIR